MEEFFAPLARNSTGGSSSFNLHDSYVSSAEMINGYFVNNTEKYLFSDSEPSAAPQAFYGGTVTSSFLPDFSALPLQNLESTLTEQNRNELNQLNGGIEGQDAITMLNKNFNPSISWELLQQEAILLEGKEQNNQNNHNFPLPYETPLPVEGSEARKTNFSNSRGDKSKQNYLNGATNGQVKTRTRARRGQATDPHSIAERQRREKISMRLKNLQELVPNSNKIDKALMLEEVIEYVKFLQIQVKMLSMSRLGGPGASLPLLAESQTENCMENSIERRGIMDREEGLGLERGVVRLMECNMINAIQFIQPKGLCLVPLKLASLIYNQNESAI